MQFMEGKEKHAHTLPHRYTYALLTSPFIPSRFALPSPPSPLPSILIFRCDQECHTFLYLVVGQSTICVPVCVFHPSALASCGCLQHSLCDGNKLAYVRAPVVSFTVRLLFVYFRFVSFRQLLSLLHNNNGNANDV